MPSLSPQYVVKNLAPGPIHHVRLVNIYSAAVAAVIPVTTTRNKGMASHGP